MPSIKQLREPYLIGNASITLRESRRRFVRKSAALEIGEFLETPTTIARDYLALVYKKGPGLRGVQRESIEQIIKRFPAFPLYAKPSAFEDGIYIDVRRAFFSVMLVSGWNVSYHPLRFLHAGRKPSDFPFQDSSIARNSLVSVAQSRELVEFFPPNHKRHVITNYNPLLNESISALIRDVLHGVARAAIACGAVYVHTDGYIAPDENKALAIAQAIRDWGLEPRVKARGPGYVRGVANYAVGDSISKWVDRRYPTGQQFLSVAEVPHERWLQNNFEFLASRGHNE